MFILFKNKMIFFLILTNVAVTILYAVTYVNLSQYKVTLIS